MFAPTCRGMTGPNLPMDKAPSFILMMIVMGELTYSPEPHDYPMAEQIGPDIASGILRQRGF